MILREKAAPLVQRPGVRQFVKFGIVGLSNTALNFAVMNVLLKILHAGPHEPPSRTTVAIGIAFVISAINGYIWNQRWTFASSPQKQRVVQFGQFCIVSGVGLAITQLIVKACKAFLVDSAHWQFILAINAAQAIATVVVVFWNFFANRFWTFRSHS